MFSLGLVVVSHTVQLIMILVERQTATTGLKVNSTTPTSTFHHHQPKAHPPSTTTVDDEDVCIAQHSHRLNNKRTTISIYISLWFYCVCVCGSLLNVSAQAAHTEYETISRYWESYLFVHSMYIWNLIVWTHFRMCWKYCSRTHLFKLSISPQSTRPFTIPFAISTYRIG